jgi:hypothetical protein
MRLSILHGGVEQSFEFPGELVTMGRAEENTVAIRDKKVSRLHCRIERIPGEDGFRVVDLGSSNGIILNGTRIKEQRLKPGDKLQVGGAVITWIGGTPACHPPPAHPQAAPAAQVPHALLSQAGPARNVPGHQPQRVPGAAAGVPLPHPANCAVPQQMRVTIGRRGMFGAESYASTAVSVGIVAIILLGGYFIVRGLMRSRDGESRSRTAGVEGDISDGGGASEAEIRRALAEKEERRRKSEQEEQSRLEREQRDKALAERQAMEKEGREKAEKERQARMDDERRKAELAAKLVREKEEFGSVMAGIDVLMKKFKFADASAACDAKLRDAAGEHGRRLLEERLKEISGQQALFSKMIDNLKGGGVSFDLSEDLVVTVTGADEAGWSATAAGGAAAFTRKWQDTTPEHVLNFVCWPNMTDDDSFALAAFCFFHGLVDPAERALLDCYKRNGGRKAEIDRLLAKARGVDVPDGGFLVYRGEWVTAEDKANLEKGLVMYKGAWLTEDQVMDARGYVKYEGRWITKDELAEMEERERELAELKKRLEPKGIINKPGADNEAMAWNDARDMKTMNYKIKTNLSVEAMQDIAYTMEVLNCNFRKVFGIKSKKTGKFEVRVCRNMGEYEKYLGGGGLGHCSSSGEISTFYQVGDQFNTTTVLMHEGTHQFMFKVAPNCAHWMQEGMASYFECSKFDGKDLIVGLKNRLRLGTVQAEIKAGTHTKIVDFIQDRIKEPMQAYHQGWSLVYYLANAHGGRYAKAFDRYMRKAGGRKEPKYFMETFGIRDMDAFEEDWKSFILGLTLDDAENIGGDHK